MSESSSDDEPGQCLCDKGIQCAKLCHSSESADDNRRRESEKWAMLAGQHTFKFESYIFHSVLPEELIKPHIFPRSIPDMFCLIDKYSQGSESNRLENAAEKWKQLCNKWEWQKPHEVVLATIKSAYLHISNPLEVMMKLNKEQGKSFEDASIAFRHTLPSKLHKAGDQVLVMMVDAGLLQRCNRSRSPSSSSLPSMHLSE